MTDPVILLGTQSNGETLPVQVDGFGRLVAEGLQGSEGPPGPEGPAGGTFPLPADPYEGALLGWLNGELSWVGTPPVPIPPGVFGPITAWDAQSGLLTVEGEIPAAIGSGVYVWQCNEDGTYFTEGWNTSQVWSDGLKYSDGTPIENPTNAFDGNPATGSGGSNKEISWTVPTGTLSGTIETFAVKTSNGSTTNEVKLFDSSGTLITSSDVAESGGGYTQTFSNVLGVKEIKIYQKGSGLQATGLNYIKLDDKILVDNDQSLNFRVNQLLGQSLLGIPSATVDFTIGKYLRVPEQRVAPWVLYGNDPTSLIDHLRSS